MSVEKKSIHVRVAPEMHERLSAMSQFHDKDISELAASWLEKMIIGEFHAFSVVREKLNRLDFKGK